MKTLKHKLRDLGVSVDYNSIYMPGKRARKRLARQALEQHYGYLRQIINNCDDVNEYTKVKGSVYINYLPDLVKFTKLMHRMPVPEDRLNEFRTFELWFALVYNDEENKPLEESVFYSESKAHKLFNSL